MTPVDQTTFHDPSNSKSGNCGEACVASLLDLPIEDVPSFYGDGEWSAEVYWRSFYKFFEDRGWRATKVAMRDAPKEDLYLAYGNTVRRIPHMVVMQAGKMVHDPHHSRKGITGATTIWKVERISE